MKKTFFARYKDKFIWSKDFIHFDVKCFECIFAGPHLNTVQKMLWCLTNHNCGFKLKILKKIFESSWEARVSRNSLSVIMENTLSYD